MSFCLPHAVCVFPAAHQFMQIFSRQLLSIFTQEVQKEHTTFDQGLGGFELTGYAARVLVHDLLQTEHEHLGTNVFGVNIVIRAVAFVLFEEFYRSKNLGFQFFDDSIVNRRFCRVVNAVSDGCLGSDTTFGV